MTDDEIKAALLDLALKRAPDKSFCPSEIARAMSDDWRPLMPRIRSVAAKMPEIAATQKGKPVHPLRAVGPIRLRLAK